MTDKFKDYLWGAQFTIYTDNNPLVQLNTARLGAVEQRWVAQLSNYTFDIKYRPGATNQNADLLSRLPEVVHDVVPSDVGPIQAEGLQVRVDEPQVPVDLWKERQQSNSDLTQLRRWLRAGKAPPNTLRRTFPPWLSCMLQEWDRLQEQDGVLYHCVEEPDTGICTRQVIVPVDYTRGLWAEYHHAAGHSSAEKVLSILRRRFFWPKMSKEVQAWTRECYSCQVNKAGPHTRAPLESIKTSYPWEVVGLDYLALGRPGDTYPYILVMTDLFSRYALAAPTKDLTAATTVKVLWASLIQPFGCPERFLTDQGAAFESALMQQLCGM